MYTTQNNSLIHMHVFKALLIGACIHTFQGFCSCGFLTTAKELMDPTAHIPHFYLDLYDLNYIL